MGTVYRGSVHLTNGPPKKYSISPTDTTKVVFKVKDNKIEKINNNLNGMIGSEGYFEGKSVLFIIVCR